MQTGAEQTHKQNQVGGSEHTLKQWYKNRNKHPHKEKQRKEEKKHAVMMKKKTLFGGNGMQKQWMNLIVLALD